MTEELQQKILELFTTVVTRTEVLLLPHADEPRAVEFKKNNEVVDSFVKTWELKIDKTSEVPALYLYTESANLYSVLRLNKEGIYHGRVIGSTKGRVAVRGVGKEDGVWKRLYEPVKLLRKIDVKNVPVEYDYLEKNLPPEESFEKYTVNLKDEILNSYVDLNEWHEENNVPINDTAIAIVACDRISYFDRVVQSIAQNKNVDSFPVFVFLDKPKSDNWEVIVNKHVEIVRQHIPNATIFKRGRNLGCGRNIIDARRQLFDNFGYDKVFVLEDDLVLSSNYFTYCLNLLEWGQANFGNIGAVQGWNKCFLSKKDKTLNLPSVIGTFTNWWGYLMTHECWVEIKNVVYEFESLFLKWDYAQRPNKSILEWFKSNYSRPETKDSPFPVSELWFEQKDKYFKSPPTGQDAITMFAFYMFGYVRLAPVVNRGQYVGQQGIHMSPNWYHRDRFHEVLLHDFSSDATLETFDENKEIISTKEEQELEGMRVIE